MSRLHAVLPTVAKRVVWNLKYGLLKYPTLAAPEDAVYHLCNSLPERTSVLELGCGRGSLLRGLREAGWSGNYCGVDISNRAIAEARKPVDQRSAWVVSDIESFRSPFRWDAIVMIESIYYINLRDLPAVLGRIMEMLSNRGILLIRLHDIEKHRDYIETAERLFPQMEKVAGNLFRLVSGSR